MHLLPLSCERSYPLLSRCRKGFLTSHSLSSMAAAMNKCILMAPYRDKSAWEWGWRMFISTAAEMNKTPFAIHVGLHADPADDKAGGGKQHTEIQFLSPHTNWHRGWMKTRQRAAGNNFLLLSNAWKFTFYCRRWGLATDTYCLTLMMDRSVNTMERTYSHPKKPFTQPHTAAEWRLERKKCDALSGSDCGPKWLRIQNTIRQFEYYYAGHSSHCSSATV